MVETSKIPDFAPLLKPDTQEISSQHPIVHVNPFNKKEIIFLSNPNHKIVGESGESEIKLQDIIEGLYKKGKQEPDSKIFYSHKWEEGDMLVWDNVQVMHRSSGAFKGKRLLLRCQARMKYEKERATKDIFLNIKD